MRIQRDYVQILQASADQIIPLLAPRREMEWADGWSPNFIYEPPSRSSEEGSIFNLDQEGKPETWIMTKHDLEAHISEFVRVRSESHVCEIKIRLENAGLNKSKAYLTYRYTALSEQGNAFIERRFTEESFRKMAREWEEELNRFLLRPGSTLKQHQI